MTRNGHHARFDLASGCTFDLWADDIPTAAVEVRDGEVWVAASTRYSDAEEFRAADNLSPIRSR
jgi:hypothetical protein